MSDIATVRAPKRVADWKGHKVMSIHEMHNHYHNFPRHTVFEVTNAGRVKYLRSLPCKCCGISGIITIRGSKDDFLMDFHFVEMTE